jgi:hypothetical protein
MLKKNLDVASNAAHKRENFQLETMCRLGYTKITKV